MPVSNQSSDNSAILRIAGCPIDTWLAAANTELFAAARELIALQDSYSTLGPDLADRIGRELVPETGLSRQERALALKVRRQLHNTHPLGLTETLALVEAAERVMSRATDLVRELQDAEECSRTMLKLQDYVTSTLQKEPARLSELAYGVVQASPLLSAMLIQRNERVFQDIGSPVGRGDAWDSKSVRKSGEYLWRMFDRAATKSTPREFLGHVALLPIDEGTSSIAEVRVSRGVAWHWSENVYILQQRTRQKPLLDDDRGSRLSVSPLRWAEDDQLEFWLSEPDEQLRVVELKVRRTDLLVCICSALDAGPRTLEDLVVAVAPDVTEDDRLILPAFIAHLARIGVLQISELPAERFSRWRELPPISRSRFEGDGYGRASMSSRQNTLTERSRPAIDFKVGEDGFLDVYRRAEAHLPIDDLARLQRHVAQALRVFVVMGTNTLQEDVASHDRSDVHARSVLEIFREQITREESADTFRRPPTDWPLPVDADTPYAKLLEWMGARVGNAETIDVSSAMLDALGIPDGLLGWPLDGLFRVPTSAADYDAVLDQIFFAGTIDARFVPFLRRLHGHLPHVERYSQFLAELERLSGIMFVEVLIPPLSERAANAVVRPTYTRAWTGDSDIQVYCKGEESAPRYVPLDAISLRVVDSKVIAEFDGRAMCPVYHATRSPQPPWHVLTNLLFSATYRPGGWMPRKLHNSLVAFPDRRFMPRITVNGGPVLSCAQWRLDVRSLWDTSATEFAKLQALVRMRDRRDLSRWLFVSPYPDGKLVPCDLESVRAIATIEQVARDAGENLLLTEMLPAPDEILVRDLGHGRDDRVVSELVLRMPYDESPSDLAARLAPEFRRHFGMALVPSSSTARLTAVPQSAS